ncbi:MAG: penicillin-binding protein 1A [Alphaproteobacteria bacterium]|nr:penicillin-binding protein 1A [Alphaproteobacteria bacterium]
MKWLSNILLALLSLGFLGGIAGIAAVAFAIHYYSQDLPDYNQLKQYEPPIITRLYAGDGNLLAEYAQEKRVFVPVQKMPDILKQAFISAEDQNFYEHQGVDMKAIARAAVTNIRNSGSGRRLIGASTITQQVAKNFLLTNEVSYARKIKEAILAMRMEEALSKDQLLELYLNEIFLGQRAYGVAAASLRYFNKPLEELSIEEAAYLAALPKAPNNYHPVRKYEAAVARRNWVIDRMVEDGYITEGQADIAKAKPLTTHKRPESDSVSAEFFAEEIRRELVERYGQDVLYRGGLAVRSSVDPKLQEIATKALRNGLMTYDKRHGYRGPVATLKSTDQWSDGLNNIQRQEGMLDGWELAIVLDVKNAESEIGFKNKDKAKLKLDGVRWARKCLQDCYALGPEIIRVSQVVSKGDVIMVEKVDESWILRQVPKVQGAIIALDPHTGRVLAMQGGWTYSASSFNRATQAKRQPGSAFKPFVYLAALDNGYTPATRVLDAPFVMEQAPGDFWRPTNYSNKYYGPSTIRMGVEKSRNLMTVRLADRLGMGKIVEYATRFGIADEMKSFLSYSLGAGETTLLRLTAAYGMLVNGGKKIDPTFMDRIQNRQGETIFSYDKRPCANCGDLIRWDGQSTPAIPDTREQLADEKTVYQIVSILEGVIERGTARRLKEIGRPLAGKTGTTNESKDTWFIGFSPDLVAGVFVGFDDPKSMGKRETGSSVAAPIWGDFIKEALKDTPPTPFRVPSGLKNVRINLKTGKKASAGDQNVIWEAFVAGTEPGSASWSNEIIGHDTLINPYGDDPYGYNQFGYGEYSEGDPTSPIYNDGSVEVYPLQPSDQPQGRSPFSYFSGQTQENPPPPQNWEEPRTAPVPPSQNNGNFTGTGGLY